MPATFTVYETVLAPTVKDGMRRRFGEDGTVVRRRAVAFGFLLLSAGMLSISIADPAFWPLGWVALWPVFHLLDQGPSLRARVALGGLWLLLISQLGFPYAVATAYHHLGGNPLGAWIMGTTLGVATSLRYLVFILLARSCAQRLFYWAAVWSACEILIWQMMPVYGGAHVLGDTAFLQWAEVLGSPGVAWLWFVLSLALFDAARKRVRPLPVLMVFGLVHCLGLVSLQHWQNKVQGSPRYTVAIIQGNQPANLLPTHSVGQQARAQMLGQTEKFLCSLRQIPQVVVWPEASLPLVPCDSLGGLRLVGSPQMVITDYEPGAHGGYVLARLLDGQGRSLAKYRKRKLILMGEYSPCDKLHSLEVGTADQLLPTNIGPALPLVCFEGLWPSFVASFHRNTGAQATWIVHMGSESSFGSGLACRQSLHLAWFRSVELRRPMVRADNSGVSGWIDAAGQLHDGTETFVADTRLLHVAIHPAPGTTLYTRWGDLPLVVLITVGSVLGLRSPRKALCASN